MHEYNAQLINRTYNNPQWLEVEITKSEYGFFCLTLIASREHNSKISANANAASRLFSLFFGISENASENVVSGNLSSAVCNILATTVDMNFKELCENVVVTKEIIESLNI